MPKTSQRNRVKAWQSRINEANKANDNWREDFHVDDLELKYAGPGQEDDENPEKYVINKIFPTVEIGIPSLLYYNPVIKIKPRPTRADDMASEVEERAKLQEDTINTFITDPRMQFKPITTLSLKESFFTFGMVEIGYTADLVDNPLLQKPELTEDEMVLAGLAKVPNFNSDQPERLYIKRIPAKNWRVPVSSHNILEFNDWCGYYEWVRIEDIKANPMYKNTSGLKSGGKQSADVSEYEDESDKDVEGHTRRDMIKVWKIWDIRSSLRYVFPDSGDKFFIEGKRFDVLPFADYRPYQMMDTFYPIPTIYNWLYPQEEINDIRNKRRIHRRRFNRRYTYLKGSIDVDQLELLESDEDGVYAEANMQEPLQPVPDAPLDPSLMRDEAVMEQDFREISGIGGEQRGEATSDTTATQANIVEFRTRIRESYRKELVGEWIAKMATIMLKLIKRNMALPFWIQMNVDPVGPGASMEAMKVARQWSMIVSDDLGELQLDISVDVTSLSPLAEEGERQAWMQALALFMNPTMAAILLSSDVLLRKTLSYFNIRSNTEINALKKAAQQMITMVAGMAAAQSAAGPGGQGQTAAPGPTPSNMDIQGQLASQMGGL